jgi:hypothetical protein
VLNLICLHLSKILVKQGDSALSLGRDSPATPGESTRDSPANPGESTRDSPANPGESTRDSPANPGFHLIYTQPIVQIYRQTNILFS